MGSLTAGTMRRLRIAFVTTEFPTELTGGMASYVHRMVTILREIGHEPEVFVPSGAAAGVIVFEGIRVERVATAVSHPLSLIARLSGVSSRTSLAMTLWHFQTARALASALQRREREMPFDLVQSCDYGFAGLFVRRKRGRPHLVRCSGATDLYEATGGTGGLGAFMTSLLERRSIRRADRAYAPSEFLSRYYRDRYGIALDVLRPPAMREVEPAAAIPKDLPERYLVYAGLIGARKGTDVLAAALPVAWQTEPSLTMVWAGSELNRGEMDRYRALWNSRSEQVRWLGFIAKADLYAIVRHADASVIPSRVDNLPNSALESLLMGTPIIGSNGASLDELVEPGRSGFLVPIGDAHALAEAMIRAWRRDVPWKDGGFVAPAIFEQMIPAVAATSMLKLAGYGG